MPKRLLCVTGIFLALIFSFATPGQCGEKIRAVATTTTLASIAQAIGGEDVEVYAVASPKQDIHFYAPTPKDVLKVKKARLFIHGGLDLESWRGPLLDAAGNPLFLGAEKGMVDASKGIVFLEMSGSLSRASGDIHVFGNPHYWLDPLNGKVIASNITDGLSRVKPESAGLFQENLEVFLKRIDRKNAEWAASLAPYRGTAILAYHRSLPYFASRFGLEIAGELEPKPGIPPTARHLNELARVIKNKSVRAIVKEFYYENHMPDQLARAAGIPVVGFVQAVGEKKEAADYFSLFDYNVRVLEQVLAAERKAHA